MRKARLLAEHTGHYHVILKATGPQFLFREDADKRTFQDILERSARFSGVGVLAYALLDNHFHLLVRVPERESVPDDEFRARVEALYGRDRTSKLYDRWDRWAGAGRAAEVALERDRLLRRMHDLGQFMKTLKEWHSRAYREAHGWEGTLWRGRYKSILVTESLDAFRDIALYIALNPVRADIVNRGTDSPWTSYGRSKAVGSFGWRCHAALLRELARLAGSAEGTDSRNGGTDSATEEGTDSLAAAFDAWVAEGEAVSREVVRGKIGRGESLSPAEMLMCRVHAFSNGQALGSRKSLESVPMPGKRISPIAKGDRLCTATRLRGTIFRVA